MRRIVLPGELLAEEPMRFDNSYMENGKTYSKVLGIYEDEKKSIVPLEGVWNPHIGDIVVGIITEVRNAVYMVDLAYFGRGILISSKYERQEYTPGTVIEAEVKNIEEKNTIILQYPKALYGGTILEVKPTKVPRIMGKANTMVSQIRDLTKTNMVVGRNGVVWMKGGNIALATSVIRQIETEAHTSGLTERIKKELESRQTSE